MKKTCPITYQTITENEKYSEAGLKLLSPKLKQLMPLPLSSQYLIEEAKRRADKLSIQGVQPKLSTRLNVTNGIFEIVDKGGTFILKPQHELYQQAPENEDLTMRLAKAAGIEVPLHGLVYTQDGALVYFIKRFDRIGKGKKIAVEDFAQLSGNSRDTKYRYSMEKLVQIIDQFTTFPLLEKAELLLRTLVNFILGNEDMHLKNFSLISRNGKVTLAPAYDFINSTIALYQAKEEIALPLNGKKRNLMRNDLLHYYAKDKLQLPDKIIEKQLLQIKMAYAEWQYLIDACFLNASLKNQYWDLVSERLERLKIK